VTLMSRDVSFLFLPFSAGPGGDVQAPFRIYIKAIVVSTMGW